MEQVEEKPLQRMSIFTRGNKFFELSNHLGNVLAKRCPIKRWAGFKRIIDIESKKCHRCFMTIKNIDVKKSQSMDDVRGHNKELDNKNDSNA